MKKNMLLLVSLLFIGAQMLQAQRTISGTVISADDNQGIPGVQVVVKGTTTGTTTNINGSYAINVPANATTLVFSFMGMTTQEREIAGMTTIDVVMGSGATELEGVIVTAYGTTRREAFTGAAAQVSGAALQERTQSNIGKALAGAAPGVQIVSSSGQPGSEATIRIRGIGSISASQDPLIIVDGVPYTAPLSTINMNDVETLTALKDAAANAMYGARGANGVILITTKKGRAGQTKVQFESRIGFNQRAIPQYDVVTDSREYMNLLWESLYNSTSAGQSGNRGLWASETLLAPATATATGTGGYTNFGFTGPYLISPDGTFNPTAKLLYQDSWFDEMSQIGVRQEYTASVSGGTESTQAFLSLGYLDDNSYIVNSNFNRYNARLKLDQSIGNWFKTGMNVAYSKRVSNTLVGDGNRNAMANIWLFGQQIAPIFPVYERDADGNFILDANGNKLYDWGRKLIEGTTDVDRSQPMRPWGSNQNPLAAQTGDVRRTNNDQVFGSFYADVKFLNDFTFTANLTIQNNNAYNISFQTPIGGDAINVGGRSYITSSKSFNINTQQLLNWERSFGLHNFEGLLGHEYSTNRVQALQVMRENFFDPKNPLLTGGIGDVTVPYNYQTDLSYDSYFARLQYNYAYKYYLSASFRRDASSRFHPDSRWGNFWALGGAWRIEQEDFMKQYNFVDLLKFKASFGVQGNDNVIYSDATNWRNLMGLHNVYNSQYDVFNSGGEIGLSLAYRGNPKLTWETSYNFNIGFDFTLFKKLSGSIECYNKETKDLIFRRPRPGSGGSPTWSFENAMSMRNYGMEIDLSYDVIKTKDLTWTIGGNITTQSNKLLSLPEGMPDYGYSPGGGRWYSIGGSIYQNYTYEFAGVDPNTGRALFWSGLDKDGKVVKREPEGGIERWVRSSDPDDATYRILSDGLVKAYGGLRTHLRYKDFDLGITMFYQIGGYGSDANYSSLLNEMRSTGRTIHRDLADNRWQKPGDLTNYPKLEYGAGNMEMANRAYTSKSAFALQSVSLGYNVPNSFLSRYGIERLRVYATVDNTALWSARSGFDPRVSVGGGAEMDFPDQRTYSLGLNVTF
ncbi:MAG: SusC/RagA family TonB-linked outer membrane protein [Bacteroidales bacterium]|nr:SusC/RagA family TonB-linked outer membrane protein [Bacteroidales bacterium]